MQQALDKSLRKLLEKAVKQARDVAEEGARAALEQLGVGEKGPYAHLSKNQRELRRKLRSHGRQLGDFRHATKQTQEIDRLAEEIAYEHWHRMLFARFLAENNLLMYPDPDEPVAIILEECEDLAADEGAKNGWELAARYAARMLPQIFRPDSPVFQLELPPEHQQKLERLLVSLPTEVFTASDSMGWVYQFWQAKKKDEVNASEVKIGARELPAVTQLFTESYMVSFLLDNSLGAWWAVKKLSADDADVRRFKTEEEVRKHCSIPGVPLEYLRFVKVPKNNLCESAQTADEEVWTPAAGTFDGWPEQLADLKTLDPCCGSGHFLVAAFLMLVPMRMELEGLSAREAVDAVLRENIHGLELDQRCVELAAFALALTAWKYPSAGGYRVLPELNVACSGLSVSVSKEDWQKLANGDLNLRIALGWIYDEFQNAPVLGSLLSLRKSAATRLVDWENLAKTLETALLKERSDEEHEAGVIAHGMAKAANLLAAHYHWVITNVPYLARGKQSEKLREYSATHYKEAKNDLATVFLDRCLELCVEGGTSSIVLPQNWLFLTTYKKFREKLLKNNTWHLIARLGPGAFETISGEVVKAILISLSRGNPQIAQSFAEGETRNLRPSASSADNLIRGLDVSEPRTAAEKAAQLLTTEIKSVEQAKQLENPDARVVLEEDGTGLPLMLETAQAYIGLHVGGWDAFRRGHWEIPLITQDWRTIQGSVDRRFYSGLNDVAYWPDNGKHHERNPNARVQGRQAWGKLGAITSPMRDLPFSLYLGRIFDNNTCTIIPHNPAHLPAIWCFCSSPEYNEAVRQIDQSLKVTNATLVKVPFDLDHWIKVAEEKYPNGLPKPYTDDPTQWIFHGHPCGSVIWDEEQKWTAHGPLRTDGSVLHVAVARLLGYRWPAEQNPQITQMDADSKTEENNRHESAKSADISSFDLSDESRFWVKQCEELHSFADEDGIVCIPPVRGEASASDRLLNLLAAAYGDAWANDTLGTLLKNADHGGKTLESWLREKFFTQHCKLFHHRPFIWHIWDGLRDGFAALVNYHKLDYKLLETLIYTYLGDWINRQKQDVAAGVDGAQERLAAAEALKKRLELILEGEAPYDIFVRWKPLERQPMGWQPDLNDGVRLNIRPFLSVPDVGKKGAGVLRDKPNIHWKKDRGKDVESAPWYHLGPLYGGKEGDRINDHHLTLAEKRAAREENPQITQKDADL